MEMFCPLVLVIAVVDIGVGVVAMATGALLLVAIVGDLLVGYDADNDVTTGLLDDDADDVVVVEAVIKLEMVLHAIWMERCNDSMSRNSG